MEWVQLAAAIGLLAANFFFVAVEFAVTNARPTMVDDLVEQGAKGARSLQHAVQNIDNYLSACQLGITIASIGLGITAEPVVKDWLESVFGEGQVLGLAATTVAFILAYAIVSVFHVVLGELTPKSLAIARTRRTGLVLVPLMRVFYLATKPLVDLLNWLGNVLLRPFGIPPASEAEEEAYSEPELLSVVRSSQRRGMLGRKEARFARAAFTFGDRRAHEVMVARPSVATLDAARPLREALGLAAESGHQRLPLCERDGDLDSALGVVDLRDLARALAAGEQRPLTDLVRPLHRTSELTLIDDLLERLRAERQQIALVVDEHGSARGIVTLEDIIEEIVGDIRDEFDQAAREPIERRGDVFRVEGTADLRAVARAVGFDPGDPRAATIGGFLTERLGHVPHPGEELGHEGFRLVADAVDGATVTAVVITPRDPDGEGS